MNGVKSHAHLSVDALALRVGVPSWIIRRERSGRGYWLTRKCAGARTLESAIGPDTEEVRAKVTRAERGRLNDAQAN